MKYSKEIKKFIAENVSGKRVSELADLVNLEFGTEFTKSKMRAYLKNYGLKTGMPTKMKGEGSIYPKEIRKFINENYIGTGHQDMADLLNDTFDTSFTKEQMKSYYARMKLDSGLTGYFPKGHIPFNKGKTKYWVGGEDTQFKKGHKPANCVPIGTERINGDDYIDVKVADGKKNKNWKGKHILIWEKANGALPKGHVIIFGDKNNRNFDINNLILVSRQQLLTLNQHNLIKNDADTTRSGITIADIKIKISERTKKK